MYDVFGSKNLDQIVDEIVTPSDLKTKIIGSTVESQFSIAIQPYNKILNTLDAYQSKIINDDFRKNFRKNNNHANVLILDLLNERYSVAKYKDSKITINTEIKKYLHGDKVITVPIEKRLEQIPSLYKSLKDVLIIMIKLFCVNFTLQIFILTIKIF